MLAPALGRNIDHRAFQNLQQSLLHSFTRYVARKRRIVALAGDLVDFVDKDNPPLGQLHVVGSHLQQPRENTLDILAHVSRLGKYRSVHDGEGYVQQFGDRAGHQRLAGTRRADQQDVRLVELHFARLARSMQQPLVVIIYGHRHIAFGIVLPDHVLIQKLLDFIGLEQILEFQRGILLLLATGCGFVMQHIVVDEHLVSFRNTFAANIATLGRTQQDRTVAAFGPAERTRIALVAVKVFSVIFSHRSLVFLRISFPVPVELSDEPLPG